MKRMLSAVAAAALVTSMGAGAVGTPVAAQDKMVTFYLCLLVTPANPAKAPADMAQLQMDHLANLKRIMESGKGVIAGPIAEEGALRGILVLRVNSIDEARAMLARAVVMRPPEPQRAWQRSPPCAARSLQA